MPEVAPSAGTAGGAIPRARPRTARTRVESGAPFARTACVAVAGGSDWDPRALVTREGNRWSRAGQPTMYLAMDPGVALAELARHMPAHGDMPQARVWTVDVRLDAVLDLRKGDPAWIKDPDRCSTVATQARQRGVQGLIVPSMAFLDEQDRANLVLFVENIADLDGVIGGARRRIALEPT